MKPDTDAAALALRRAKRQALGLLLLVTAVFVATSVVERGLGLNAVKAMVEAAMVGALADWFAVVALFRRPLGLPIPHTAVIARNQARIGRNLATFVRDKFLDVPSLVALIRRHDPAGRLAEPDHRRLARSALIRRPARGRCRRMGPRSHCRRPPRWSTIWAP